MMSEITIRSKEVAVALEPLERLVGSASAEVWAPDEDRAERILPARMMCLRMEGRFAALHELLIDLSGPGEHRHRVTGASLPSEVRWSA
jgi:hypothetical protein